MSVRGDCQSGLRAARRCAAACVLLLASCVPAPALTLSASANFRTRQDGAAAARTWTAGARLGWSARSQPRSRRSFADATAIDPRAYQASAANGGDAAPCVFEATCRWERQAGSAALRRTHEILAGDGP